MAPTRSTQIRDWAVSLEPGTLFTLDEAQQACSDKSRAAVKSALGRLCKGEDPVLARAVRGLYSRRLVGSQIPIRLGPRSREQLPWKVAGPGAGLAGLNAVNYLCWTTQVPSRLCIAVVGRPPKTPDNSTVYMQRSNSNRRMLTKFEVTLIESVKAFDEYAEVDWGEALSKLVDLRANSDCVQPKSRPSVISAIACSEYRKSDQFINRCNELSAACA